jgi:hypothetical protein
MKSLFVRISLPCPTLSTIMYSASIASSDRAAAVAARAALLLLLKSNQFYVPHTGFCEHRTKPEFLCVCRLATIRSLTAFNDQNVTFAVVRNLAGASPSVPAGFEFLTPHSQVDYRRRDQPWDRSSKCLHFPQRRFH